jgi:hypothetical protein
VVEEDASFSVQPRQPSEWICAACLLIALELVDAVADDDRFSLRSLGYRTLRHIGEGRVYRLRSGAEWVIESAEALAEGHEAAIRGR